MKSYDAGLLPVVEPLDFRHSLRFLDRFPPTRGDQVVTETSLTRACSRDGVCAAVTVEQIAEGLRCTVRCEQPLAGEIVAAHAEHIADLLSTRDDLSEFVALAAQDPPFDEVERVLHGFHHVKLPSLAAAMCWSVLSQRVPLATGRRMLRDVVHRYGRSITVDGTELWAFPEPADLADARVDELAALLRNTQRAGYLANVCAALAELDQHELRTAPIEEAEARLGAITGIGPFATTLILVRGLGRMDYRPIESRELLGAIERVYGRARPLAELASHYGDQLGYFSFYARNAP